MTYETEKAEALMNEIAAKNVAQALAGKRLIEVNRGQKQIVKLGEFIAEMKKAGISYPTDYITCSRWLQPIAKKVLPKYQRQLKRPNHVIQLP